MKKMLLIVPNLRLGGQERIAVMTAGLLSETYDVTLIVFDGTNRVYTPPCEWVDIEIPAQNGMLRKAVNVFARTKKLRELRKKKNADFVYSFGGANLPNVLSRGVGKTIIGFRGYRAAFDNSLITKYIKKHCDIIICCAREMCRALEMQDTAYLPKTGCLYNPLDISELMRQGTIPVEDVTFSGTTVVSHGRLETVKNWPRLIKAFSIVKQAMPNAKLIIIGEGTMRSQLEGLIGEYGLQDSAYLIGFRSNPFAYLAKSTLYVLPSYSEGFPNSLVEGMTFLPTISVDCKSGPREILSRESADAVASGVEIADYGVLVQPAVDWVFHREITEDDKILADAMLTVLQNQKLAEKLKVAAYKRAKEFSCEQYRVNLISILEK